jgi:parallel beta-helix repeat protein
VITQSIVVRNDLTDCLWDGLVVGAPGITIDLNGHTIDGKGIAAGIRNDGYDFVSIKNGYVKEFDYGVMLNPNTTDNIVEGMILELNQEAGIGLGFLPHPLDPITPYPLPPSPTFQAGVRDNILRNNILRSNDTGIWLIHGTRGTLVQSNELSVNAKGAILIDRSSDSHVEGNQITMSGADAIQLVGASGNTILNNTLVENDGGITLMLSDSLSGYMPSDNNRVEGNVITESGGPAIDLAGSGQGLLSGNQIIAGIQRCQRLTGHRHFQHEPVPEQRDRGEHRQQQYGRWHLHRR